MKQKKKCPTCPEQKTGNAFGFQACQMNREKCPKHRKEGRARFPGLLTCKQRKISPYPGPPLEPELEDVVVASALDDLVAGVVADVVVLVALEQVVRAHLVAADQQALLIKQSFK